MKKYIYTPYFITIASALVIFVIHILPVNNSMLNGDFNALDDNTIIANEYMNGVLDFHNEEPSFARRPMVTKIIEFLVDIFNINNSTSFIIVNFIFLFVLAYLINVLSKLFELSKREQNMSLLVFFTSFSILFAFFPPIYTYDDFLQYIFLFITIICLKKEQLLLSGFMFLLATITRESSVIILPGLAYVIWKNKLFNIKLIKFMLVYFMSVVGFVLFTIWVVKNNGLEEESTSQFLNRFEPLYLNFQNSIRTIETITSFFLVLTIPVLLVFKYKLKNISGEKKKLVIAFLITLIFNCIIIFTTTKARESRLFALPLVFVWPFLGWFVNRLKFYKREFTKFQMIGLVAFIALGIHYSFSVYIPSDGGNSGNFFNEYLFLELLVFLFLSFFTKFVYQAK